MGTHVKKDKANYFYTIGVSGEFDYNHFSLILDANAVISLRNFYYKPHSMRSDQKNGVVELLINNYKRDFIPGFGIFEASYHPSSSIQRTREEDFILPIEEMYSWCPSQVLKHAASQGVERKKKQSKNPKREINTYIPMLERLPLLSASYACLLMIHLLNMKKRNVSGIKLYEEFMLFQNDELKTMCSLESILAFDYFIHNKDYVSKLMKFGSPNLRTLSNTCWDIFYLRLLHNNFYKGLEGIVNPKLITSDKGLAQLSTNSSLKVILDLDSTQLSMVMFNTDINDREIQRKLTAIQNKITLGSFERYRAPAEERLELIIDVVNKLEKQLYNLNL